MNKISKQKNKGFTIIETLVAIFVLLMATTGPLAFTQQGLQASFLARDQITAFFLAQESIEILKNIRDNNVLIYRDGINPSVEWLDNFGHCLPSNNPLDTVSCNVGLDNSNNIGAVSCNNSACSLPLYFNSTNNTFVLDTAGNSPSKYTRTIYATRITNEEIQIIVEVIWESAFSAPKRIFVQENIFKNY